MLRWGEEYAAKDEVEKQKTKKRYVYRSIAINLLSYFLFWASIFAK